MDRREKVISGITKTMVGLEIGAGFRPMTPKAEGWSVTVVDHTTREELCAKYAGCAGVNTALIEEVDVIWNAGPLHTCFAPAQQYSFDYCIASHLIEHIPDLISFLDSVERLLKEDGILSLAVPDKRYCFDAFKPITTTADVLYTHARGATRHTRKTAFENHAYNVMTSGKAVSWGAHPIEELSLFSSLQEWKEPFEETGEDASVPYVDYHAWYFTPASFRLLFAELHALGLTRFYVEKSFPTEGCEFYVHLRVGRASATESTLSSEQRIALMVATVDELAQQYDLFTEELLNHLSKFLPAKVAFRRQFLKEQLERERDQLIQERNQLVHERDDLSAQLNMLLGSHSWRITAPLRWMKNLSHRLAQRPSRKRN